MSDIGATLRVAGSRISYAILYAIAAVYFIVDVAFLSVIRPLRRRLLGGGRLHSWIEGLSCYAALSLVVVPLAILRTRGGINKSRRPEQSKDGIRNLLGATRDAVATLAG